MYLLNVFTLSNQRKNKKEYIKIGALKGNHHNTAEETKELLESKQEELGIQDLLVAQLKKCHIPGFFQLILMVKGSGKLWFQILGVCKN